MTFSWKGILVVHVDSGGTSCSQLGADSYERKNSFKYPAPGQLAALKSDTEVRREKLIDVEGLRSPLTGN